MPPPMLREVQDPLHPLISEAAHLGRCRDHHGAASRCKHWHRRGPQTSPWSGSRLRPGKGDSKVGTDSGATHRCPSGRLSGHVEKSDGLLWSQVKRGRPVFGSPASVSGRSRLLSCQKQVLGGRHRVTALPRDFGLGLSERECHSTGKYPQSNSIPSFFDPWFGLCLQGYLTSDR